METHTVFFAGKPGCGKSTQAALLAEHEGWPVFASGALFRELAKEDTPVGRKLKRENDTGLLSPNWFAAFLYLRSLFSVPAAQSVVFDGFSRTLSEADLVIHSLAWFERPFRVMYLDVSDEEARRRLAGRRATSGRADDSVVDERLKAYHTNTTPAVELLRAAGVVIDVPGERSPESIAVDIRVALGIV